MKTAVQWLETILEGQKDKPFVFDEWSIAFEHAKAMEKDQIKDAYYNGKYNNVSRDTAEQYYTETYEQDKQG